jgi:hypothetical protein
MLEQGRLRLPVSVDLISELEAYESTETETIPKYNAGYGHDDRVIALALAVQGLPRGGGVTMQGIERK